MNQGGPKFLEWVPSNPGKRERPARAIGEIRTKSRAHTLRLRREAGKIWDLWVKRGVKGS